MRRRCKEAARVQTKLDILKIMYKRMLRLKIGTRSVESEAMKIVSERLGGPTGHHLLLRDLDENEQSMTEEELKRQDLNSQRKCWRDPLLVLKLVKVRLKEIKEKQSRARKVVSECLREAPAVMNSDEVKKLWKEVKEEKKVVWEENQPKHQQKVEHMRKVTANCGRHMECRRMDELRCQRRKMWMDTMTTRVAGEEVKPGATDNTLMGVLSSGSGTRQEDQSTPSPGAWEPDAGLLDCITGLRQPSTRLPVRKELVVMESGAEDQPGGGETSGQEELTELVPRSGAEEPGARRRLPSTWTPGQAEPAMTVSGARDVLHSRQQDLCQLSEEEKVVVAKCTRINKSWGKSEEEPVPNNEVVIYGDVTLDEEEIELLNLGPGYMVVSDLTKEDMQVESTVTLTKMRWGRRSKNQDEMTDQEIAREELLKTDEDLANEENERDLEQEARDVISTEGNELCMGRMRATDMRNNRDVKMPAPASARLEAMYNTRAGLWETEHAKFVRNECEKSGAQKESNLTKEQQLALERLKKKVSKVEIIVLEADKGKRFVVVDQATYVAMSKDHIEKDRTVSPEEVRRAQREMSSTAKALTTIMGLGRDHQQGKNHARCHDNAGSGAEDAPVLKLLPKVHKDNHHLGHPQSRPVVAAASGLTSRAGDILADVLSPLIHLEVPRHEDKSTEEVLCQLGQAQEAMKEAGSTKSMVGSLDVRALYPSLDQEGSADMVADMVARSKVRITGVDFRAAQVFLASNLDEDQVKKEGLKGLLPSRMHRRGARPGPTTDELSVKKPSKPRGGDAGLPDSNTGLRQPSTPTPTMSTPTVTTKWRMTNPERDLDENQKRFILSKVVKVAIIAVFKNHLYTFNGVTYVQLAGGPIGLRLTSIVARVVMDSWMVMFLVRLDDAGFHLWAIMKYVDDINVVCDMVDRGWRWEGARLAWKEEWAVEEEMEATDSDEMRTMKLIQQAANEIVTWLDFTLDLPELHQNGKVPMLDVEVWVDRRQGREDVLMWDFYEKKSSSSRVLQASSAYTWRAKLVTMNMEMFRRHRNTCRQVTHARRVEVMGDFVRKLRRSGYGVSTVNNIIVEGSRFYYRRMRTDLEGGPGLNRRSEDNLVMSRRMKLGAAETWFVRKRGGERERWDKENGWRSAQQPADQGSRSLGAGCWAAGSYHRVEAAQHPAPRGEGVEQETLHQLPVKPVRRLEPEATLKVPYTVRSRLRERIQKVEEEYARLLGCRKVRVVEGGGDKLIHLLGRNNPWAAQQVCSDESCKTCISRTWIREQLKAARKEKSKPPKHMVSPGSSLCRREGANYTLQCLECLKGGVDSRYQGETSRSGRQRHREHEDGLESGSVSNPMVVHSVEHHGGKKPDFLAVVSRVEPSALYRACREAVQIANQPAGLRNINRCMEWGSPRVPVLVAEGGDPGDGGEDGVIPANPRPDWSKDMLMMIKEGTIKRVRLWTGENPDEREGSGEQERSLQPTPKRRKRTKCLPDAGLPGCTTGLRQPSTRHPGQDVMENGERSSAVAVVVEVERNVVAGDEDAETASVAVGGEELVVKHNNNANVNVEQDVVLDKDKDKLLMLEAWEPDAGLPGCNTGLRQPNTRLPEKDVMENDDDVVAADTKEEHNEVTGVVESVAAGCDKLVSVEVEKLKRKDTVVGKEKKEVEKPRFASVDIRTRKIVTAVKEPDQAKCPVEDCGLVGRKPGTRRIKGKVLRQQQASIGNWLLRPNHNQDEHNKAGMTGASRGRSSGQGEASIVGGGGGESESQVEKEEEEREKNKEHCP